MECELFDLKVLAQLFLSRNWNFYFSIPETGSFYLNKKKINKGERHTVGRCKVSVFSCEYISNFFF